MRNTKIVVTLGPATDHPDVIRTLIEAGVDTFRLNASHGTLAEHADRIRHVRSISDEIEAHCAILFDLQGPKIRLGKFENGGCLLTTGSLFTITVEEVLGNVDRASTTYEHFAKDVNPGDKILLADGRIELRVLETDGISVRTRVVSGERVTDHQGINLPGVKITAPSFTEKDAGDLAFGLEHKIDFVALSFVRTAQDVIQLRTLLQEKGTTTKIIAKIEKPEGWANLDAIIAASDGLMVARGDLGVEMELEQVPFIQKTIIERARKSAKVVITATQMLESMIHNPFPTRAEVSDVANAIYDGTDAVMLSGETSIGEYPIEAVKMMIRIAAETESSHRFHASLDLPLGEPPTYPQLIAAAAGQAAASGSVLAIAVFTISGFAARLISRIRPAVPIFAFTPSPLVARELSLSYGVHPVLAPTAESTDQMIKLVDEELLQRTDLKPGDGIAVVAGQPIGMPGTTNLLKLHRLGELV
ncbi:MAG TPA: pyruvate kinase [Candidatus Binataceae bacterium]|nr:pyruvate kinase [Candidatus Binataceae bacterium]